MHDHNDDLEYTADGIRDRSGVGGVDEQHVQASMQEETAKAMHRQAAAMENMAEEMRKTRKALDSILREEYGL